MLTKEQIVNLAQAIGAMPEDHPLWVGMLELVADQVEEADEFACHHDTPEEKRAGWCGRKRGLADLLKDLKELRSGAYLGWPEMRATRTHSAEIDAQLGDEDE